MVDFTLDSRTGPKTRWLGFCVCGWGCRPALAREVLDSATRHEREASGEEQHEVEIRFSVTGGNGTRTDPILSNTAGLAGDPMPLRLPVVRLAS
jgi:hypothetical protein